MDPDTPVERDSAMIRTRKMPLPDWTSQVSRRAVYTERKTQGGFREPNLPLTVTNRITMLDPTSTYPRGSKITTDETHPRWRSKDKPSASDGDYGGIFDSLAQSVTVSNGGAMLAKGVLYKDASDVWHQNDYFGPWLAVNPTTLTPFTAFPRTSDSALNALGTTAIARCKPTNSIANASVMLGELWFDGLPKLFGLAQARSRTLAAKASSEYLNAEFGWKPLISDIRSVAYAAANADRILSEYERLAGRPVRRRYVFPTETVVTSQDLGIATGFLVDPFAITDPSIRDTNRAPARLYKTTVHTREVWFSGAFTYHLPLGYGARSGLVGYATAAQHLLGLELTPETVWNLAPWSWAVDWLSNLGDVVSNLSDWATDGLVMKYGYIMERINHEEIYTLVGPGQFRFPSGSSAGTVTLKYESKRRLPATPFGFGLNWNTFSPRQLAITAALGINRVFR
uniref:Maturation n=1 Tax=Leviviridae sp. TaxID=2027243 RepID=A0A514DCQ6_9VIRU|nr:MAG: hypothetical protein H2RhizoLitter491253_000001 [Leviviridae sp.]